MGLGAPRGRAPDARPHGLDHRQVLQERAVRRAQGRPPHRPRPGARPRARAQAEAPLVRHDGVPADARLRRRSAPSPTRSARSSSRTSRTSRGSSAAGVHPSPVGIADVVTSTTHKTFRGPRGGMILCKKEHAAAIDKAVFPGLQGGPHNHVTAAIAVAAHEAARPEFKEYARAIVENAKALGERARASAASASSRAGRTTTCCSSTSRTRASRASSSRRRSTGRASSSTTTPCPFDPRKPFDPSGVRIGTPAVTSRGMGKDAMAQHRRLDRPRRRRHRPTRRSSRRSPAR